MNPTKTGGELQCFGMVSSSCSTSATRRVKIIIDYFDTTDSTVCVYLPLQLVNRYTCIHFYSTKKLNIILIHEYLKKLMSGFFYSTVIRTEESKRIVILCNYCQFVLDQHA